MPITHSETADVEANINGWPSRDMLRNNTRKWSVEMFEYAESRIEQLTSVETRLNVRTWIGEYKAERMRMNEEMRRESRNDKRHQEQLAKFAEIEAERKREDARHTVVIERLDQIDATVRIGTKTHWTVSPNFWLTFVAAVAGVLAVILAK